MRSLEPSPPAADARRTRLEPERHDALHPELDDWRANVGSPIAVDIDVRAPDRIAGIDVLCWNMAIGLGDLRAVLDRLRRGAYGGAGTDADRPLVLLVQEVFRQDDTVPGSSASRYHGGTPAALTRTDIVKLAEEHGLSLRYSPSMRNGAHPSDRGNAVLATVRLDEAHAFLLPYVRQRRVAVTATMAGHPDLTFVSAHLDTHGGVRGGRRRWSGGGRVIQAQALAAALDGTAGSLILGADLNSMFGMSDPAVRVLIEHGMHPARRVGQWRHTFHRPFRLLLDHVLYRSTDHRIVHAEVVRIDETAGDRSIRVFGSDHHPLLARLELRS